MERRSAKKNIQLSRVGSTEGLSLARQFTNGNFHGVIDENLSQETRHTLALGAMAINAYRVPHSYETPPSYDPTVGLYLGSYGCPRGGGQFLVSEIPLYHRQCRRDRGKFLVIRPGEETHACSTCTGVPLSKEII